jgi:hypothetical protein
LGRGIVLPVDAMQTEHWSADLLDYLAVHLADNRHDLKSTIRLIATSQAYQSQSLSVDEQPNRPEFVYAGPLAKRMTAEQFVDALWQITGAGPQQPHGEVAKFLKPEEKEGRAWFRASLEASDFLMRSLGRPNREQVVSDRPAMLTTLQALDLFNSPLLSDTLHRGGPNILKRFDGGEPAVIINWLYEFALSRPPTESERSVATELLGSPPSQQGAEDLLWGVIMLPEFQIIR